MTTLRISSGYRPLPQQKAFHTSTANVRGFGGAMGGGKTRALCEEVFDHMLDSPGIDIAVVRQKHTAILETTRKTFLEQVLPQELRGRKDLVRIKQSQGEDLVEFLWNGSKVVFVGLDDPGKFFSAEYGMACFDEAHEIMEADVITVNSRLRQKCPSCHAKAAAWAGDPRLLDECPHYPHSMVLTFNPSHPGHWLRRWFILGTVPTEWGHKKTELKPTGSDSTIGTAEFFFSRATDNLYLSKRYVEQNLGGMPEKQRRRFLEGYWEYIDESGFFDADALARLTETATTPILTAEPKGNLQGADSDDKIRLQNHKMGRLHVWKPPVRWHTDEKTGDEVKAHRYVVAVDASSGTSSDYSAIQVVSVEEYAQVAEWQGMVDPDLLAEAAFRVAVIYNGALLAPEITGGWGFAVTKRCQALIGKYQGPPHTKPKLYTRPIVDRISQQWTDRLGWDTTMKSRAQMLDILEQSLRDGSLEVNGVRTIAELGAFTSAQTVSGEYRTPRAAQGEHDDLVISLAIGVAVASKLPKKLRRIVHTQEQPEFTATGW